MELIIVVTKPVVDQVEAESFAEQVKTFVANNPVLNNPDVRVEMETRERID